MVEQDPYGPPTSEDPDERLLGQLPEQAFRYALLRALAVPMTKAFSE